MKADRWSFRIINLLIACLVTTVLWVVFSSYVNNLFFLVPLYWIMHVRDYACRMRELSLRLKVATEVIAELMEDAADPQYQYEEALERHGFYKEAEKWSDDHVNVSPT